LSFELVSEVKTETKLDQRLFEVKRLFCSKTEVYVHGQHMSSTRATHEQRASKRKAAGKQQTGIRESIGQAKRKVGLMTYR
jgi:hypothetical protein